MRIAVAVVAVVTVALAVAACGGPPPPAPAPRVPRAHAVAVAVVSPGPLIAAHTALVCNDCHIHDSAELANDKCLACHAHAELTARIAAARGFHASALVARKPCAACHADHRGAAFDALGWSALPGGRDAFDHDHLTGWPLAGGHAGVTCDRCHTRTTAQGRPTYMGTERLCGACHKTQPHGIERRELLACERCHTDRAWRPSKPALAFNHDDRRDARMPLLGAHASVACAKCHAAARFNLRLPDPAACEGCHRGPHAGTIYTKRPCAECHSPTFAKLSSITFDHNERTRFDLGLSHRQLACAACHTAALRDTPPSAACETCHASRSPHQDRFKALGAPPACGLCHAPTSPYDPKTPGARGPWRLTTFDHAKHASWPLTHKHAQIGCRDCHRGSTPTDFERLKPGTDCTGCHAHATVHRDAAHPTGRYTSPECTQCHR